MNCNFCGNNKNNIKKNKFTPAKGKLFKIKDQKNDVCICGSCLANVDSVLTKANLSTESPKSI